MEMNNDDNEDQHDGALGIGLFNRDAVMYHFASPHEAKEHLQPSVIYLYVLSQTEHTVNTMVSFFESEQRTIVFYHLSTGVSPGVHISHVQSKLPDHTTTRFVVLKNDSREREEKTIIPPNIIMYNFTIPTNIFETADFLRKKMLKKQKQFERRRCSPIVDAEFEEFISQLFFWNGKLVCNYATTYRCSCYLFLFLGMFHTLRLYKISTTLNSQ